MRQLVLVFAMVLGLVGDQRNTARGPGGVTGGESDGRDLRGARVPTRPPNADGADGSGGHSGWRYGRHGVGHAGGGRGGRGNRRDCRAGDARLAAGQDGEPADEATAERVISAAENLIACPELR